MKTLTKFNKKCNKFFLKLDLNNWQIIFCLFIFSFALRLLFINDGLFHHDSILLSNAVTKTINTGVLQPTLSQRYGLVIAYLVPYYLYSKIFGITSTEFIFNFMTTFYGALAVIFLYLFSKKYLKNSFIAISSALLFAVTPIFFSITTYTKNHGLSIMLALCSIFLLIKSIEKKSLLLSVLSASVIGYSLFVRVTNILLFIPIFLLYFHPYLNFKIFNIKKNISFIKQAFLFFPLFIISGILVFIIQNKGIMTQIKYEGNRFLGIFSPLLSKAFFDLCFSMTYLGLFFFIIGIIFLFINMKEKLFPLLTWIFMFFFYYGNVSSYSPRFFVELLPPLMIIIAAGVYFLFKESKLLSVFTIILLVVMMFVSIYPVVNFRKNYSGEKEFALFVKRITEKKSIIISMDDSVFINYYAKRSTIGHPIGNPSKTKNWIKQIKSFLDNKTPVYLMQSAFSYDPGKIVKKELFANFNLIEVGNRLAEDYHHASIKLNPYYQRLFKVLKKNELAK